MPNALAHEKSPYLRQHQSNPVEWLPWGDEVFTRAQRESKPILLSIGYAACHWCHVMARESFEDAQTAAVMNDLFINVKVDREERPDVDAVYVRALQAMGRRAGWPLTIFLTPTGKPFWGGTYFPPVQKGQHPAFQEVLRRVSETYHADPANAEARAADVLNAIAANTAEAAPEAALGANQIVAVADELLRNFDTRNGGLQGAPKFPYVALLRFLWNTGARTGRQDMQDAVVLTLTRMSRGGIFDHLGGGFARYSTDAEWLVPHFEKMLYDNALLVHLITDVWRAKRLPELRSAAERTIEWLLREMRLPGGAFACSLDADTEEDEGAFYVWTEDEIDALLGPHAASFKQAYGVSREGNFEHRNVLNRLGASANLSDSDEAALEECRAVLFRARSERMPPRRDEKVLADWNGLAIAALAKAGAIFGETAWVDAARAAFDFVISNMIEDGELYHSWCDGELGAGSILDDHAYTAHAALCLYEATGDTAYFERSQALVARAVVHFGDAGSGAFYLTPTGDRSLVARICEGRDGATPSGNGVMAHVLARLYHITGEERYREQAKAVIGAFAGNLERESFQLATLLDASAFLAAAVHIVIVGNAQDPATEALVNAALLDASPDNIVTRVHAGTKLGPQHPAAGKLRADGRAAAYVCAAGTCAAPVSDAQSLRDTLDTYKKLEEIQ